MKNPPMKEPFVRVPHRLIRTLTPPELQVWCAIQLHAPTFTVRTDTLAKDLKKDPSGIRKIIKRLTDLKLVNVTVIPSKITGMHDAHQYHALLPKKKK